VVADVGVDEASLGIDNADSVLGSGQHLGQRRQAQRGGIGKRR
jgi:hypothetical protein